MQPWCISAHTTKIGFKALILIGHAAVTIPLAVLLLRDRGCAMVQGQYWETGDGVRGSTAQLHHNVWPVMVDPKESAYSYNVTGHMFREDNCISGRCVFSGIPPSVLVQYNAENDYTIGGANNIVFLMTLFEWITVGFAVISLLHAIASVPDGQTPGRVASLLEDRLSGAIWGSVIVWNTIGVCVWCATAHTIPLNNTWIGIVLGIIGTLFQLWPSKPAGLIPLRYIEYAITAPVLLIAVQGVTMGSNGWSMYAAFTCMMATNLLGISMHRHAVNVIDAIELPLNEGELEPFNGTTQPRIPALTTSKNEPHGKTVHRLGMYICLFASWIAFTASWIGYFSQVSPVFANLPENIKVMVAALPISFALFGAVGTAGTLTMHSMESKDYNIAVMDVLYDVLSLFIKLLVVGIVTAGDLFSSSTRSC
jgi:hypothetical protein